MSQFDIEADLARITLQEARLQFSHFDGATAWELGCRLKTAAEARSAALALEIRLAGQTVFFHAMAGTTPLNADWARRKRNLVELQHKSSYAIGLALQRDGQTLETKLGLATRDYAAHGGSFPLRLAGCGCIGTITVSGLPQREDHALIISVLADCLGLPLAELALD
ncbi:heme-degrading domain-containing protein [Pseudogulbenkiania sp. MAI-1]|uniref:heme-degrading domain-containing protein n=1 Tax=Pseudogulbenkiania sp. MAI-1 TaxID=990370 RepID=UPI00045EAE7A|nr:heme-degrading domain-containing protein [Pseudogulbenkiania sp. MAI-1]